MNKRAIIAAGTAAAMIVGLGACGSSNGDSSGDTAQGKVYYLNSKPEVVDQFDELAKAFTDETGIKVDVVTATMADYETTLTSELAKSEPSTTWTMSPNDLAKYKKYLTPMQDTDVYKNLTDAGKASAVQDSENVYAIPYVQEWYGIIYNKKIVKDYCSKDYAVIKSADDIKDWPTLKAVAESMMEHKDDLGLEGAFTTPSVENSDYYRFTAHMIRPAEYFEYKDNNTTFMPEITWKYLDNYKDLYDLQVNTSPGDAKTDATSMSYEDVTAQFSLGEVAFYPNGVWAYSQIKDNNVADEDLGMLPYYMGIPGEEDYGPGVIMDNQWVVNKNASKADQEATLKFIEWVQTSDEAKRIVAKEMGFAMPATTYGDDAQPDNPLVDQALAYQKEGKKYIRSFELPSLAWQKDFGGALLGYVQGTKDWDNVRKVITDEWKSTWEANEKAAPGSLPAQKEFTE